MCVCLAFSRMSASGFFSRDAEEKPATPVRTEARYAYMHMNLHTYTDTVPASVGPSWPSVPPHSSVQPRTSLMHRATISARCVHLPPFPFASPIWTVVSPAKITQVFAPVCSSDLMTSQIWKMLGGVSMCVCMYVLTYVYVRVAQVL